MALSLRDLRAACARRPIGGWLLEGEEKATGLPLSICVAAQLESKNYLAGLAFRRHRERALGFAWRGKMLREVLSARANHMITVFDGEAARRRPACFEVPSWVYGEIVLEQAMARMRESRNIGRDLERLRRQGLTCEWTRDAGALADFYWRMYLPYGRSRFGEGAVLVSWPAFLQAIPRAELMLVKRDGQAIAGGVLVRDGTEIISWVLGVRDGDPALVRTGVLSALYCFKIPELRTRGHERVQIGSTRAFLSDGVLRFKRKWGARLIRASAEHLQLTVRRLTPGACAFLQHNPFIYRRSGELRAAVWAGGGVEPATLFREYMLPGLAAIDLYAPGNPLPLTTQAVAGDPGTRTENA